MSDESIGTSAWDLSKLPGFDSIQRIPPREREVYRAALREWLDEHDIKLAYEAWVIRDTVHAHVYLANEDGRRHSVHSDDGTLHLGHACGCEGRAIEVAKGVIDVPLLRDPPVPLP